MTRQTGDGARLYRRLALTATVLAVGLITLGGVVRLTGSGMGCGDHWPLCNGRILPNLRDTLEVIEWSHRWVASLLSATVVALAAVGWRSHRRQAALRNPATLAAIVLIAQVLLGAVTVKLGTAAPAVVIHLTNAMVLLAVLVVCVLRSAPDGIGGRDGHSAGGPRLPELTAALGFATIVFGAFVANYDAGVYCLGFPLCGGELAPPATALGRLQWAHRLLAFTFLGFSLATLGWSQRLPRDTSRPIRRAAHAVVGLTVLQILIAAVMILQLLPTPLRALHLFLGSLVWLSLVVLVRRSRSEFRVPSSAHTVPSSQFPVPGSQFPALSSQFPVPGSEVPANNIVLKADSGGTELGTQNSELQSPPPSLAADLITLTKPRIISLLLLTTVAPMFITGHGVPSFSLVAWVMLGGYLMAGGANTINMWFDRDIDCLMARTRLRPIPSGRLPAAGALLFGLAQAVAAFAMFWLLVNPLSAWLALAGLLFYVFIYTVWLKRSSPQNIVIGGAAGAFPPLVGWTAMTGHLDLAAIYLFAIIFFWTPPHFWALALVKRQDYARAGIPMMPVVAGEHWTKVQMLAYTLMLVPLTLMPSVFGALGLFYAAIALGLGGRLLWYCVRLLRDPTLMPTAWRMYKYSLLYLALLFVAMGLDRAVPFGHRFERAPILILDRPEPEALVPGVHPQH
jgi:protoheme IX farnesyltransferase